MLKKVFIFCFVVICGYVSYMPKGCAGPLPSITPDSPTCSADIMVSMYTRGWLEAQRENMQNNNLIAKPDSVMEYSCFGGFLNELAKEAENMFSENLDAWAETPGRGISTSSLDDDLQGLVGASLSTYLSDNFGHDYLGGRWVGEDYSFSGVSGADYTCQEMMRVWMRAKCVDFGERDEDSFRTFRQYVGYEPRTLPSPCSPVDPRYQTYYRNVFSLAGEPGAAPWRTNMATTMTTLLGTIDDIEDAGSCSSSPIIKTGLTFYNVGTAIEDAICVTPGCYHNGTGGCTSL